MSLLDIPRRLLWPAARSRSLHVVHRDRLGTVVGFVVVEDQGERVTKALVRHFDGSPWPTPMGLATLTVIPRDH